MRPVARQQMAAARAATRVFGSVAEESADISELKCLPGMMHCGAICENAPGTGKLAPIARSSSGSPASDCARPA